MRGEEARLRDRQRLGVALSRGLRLALQKQHVAERHQRLGHLRVFGIQTYVDQTRALYEELWAERAGR